MLNNFSPRSYVFNGLNIMRCPLIKYIYDQISHNKNWFNEQILSAVSDDERRNISGTAYNLDELYEVMDELKCFHVLEAPINCKYFVTIQVVYPKK